MEINPSYLVTKAYSDLHLNKPLDTIKTLKETKKDI